MTITDRLVAIEARANAATDRVNEEMGDTIYSCSRDWTAWSYGTMGLDDFSLAAEDPDIAESLVSATANADVPALVAALRAVLDLCDSTPEPYMPVSQSDIRDAVEAALGEATP